MVSKYDKKELWYITNYLINYLVHSKDMIAEKRIAGYIVLNACKEQLESQVKIGQISSINVDFMLSLMGWAPDNQRVDLNSVIVNLKQLGGVLYKALHVFDLNENSLDSLYAGGQINTKVYEHASLLLNNSSKIVNRNSSTVKKLNNTKQRNVSQGKNNRDTVSSYVELQNTVDGKRLIEWVLNVVQYECNMNKGAIIELYNFIVLNGGYIIKVRNSMADYPSAFICTVSELLTDKGLFVRRELSASSDFVIGEKAIEKVGNNIKYVKNNTALHSKLNDLLVKLNLRY